MIYKNKKFLLKYLKALTFCKLSRKTKIKNIKSNITKNLNIILKLQNKNYKIYQFTTKILSMYNNIFIRQKKFNLNFII